MGIKKFNAVQGFSVGQNDTIYDVIDSAANVTANNLTVTGNTDLGPVANVKITGGTANYVLKTDGLGNLSWENPADVGVIGSNTEVQFNDNNLFGSSANFTFNKSTKTLTVDNIVANGIGLTNMNGANVTGTIANSNYAAYAGNITIAAQPNITSVGTLVTANVTGNLKSGNANLGNLVVANYVSGDGYLLANITGANVTGTVTDATTAVYAGTVTTRAQPNITSVGTLVTANITGNLRAGNANLGNLVSANYFSGDGGLVSNITGANVTGTVSDATTAVTAGTVTTRAQPNITSLGTLTSLTTGLITATSGGIKVGNIQDPSGSNVITLASGDVSLTGNLTIGTGGITGNFVSLNASLGNLATANYFSGAGNLLSNIVGGNVTGQVANALIAGTVTASAQPNITSVGTLIRANITGNVSSGNANLGNLATANYFSGDGGLLSNVNGGNITSQVANAIIAGTVYTNAQPNITSVGTLSSLTVTANISSGNANLGNLVTANYITGTLTTNAQPNITSVGTLSSLTVTANISSGNANLGNLVTANYFTGSGNLLSNIQGGNVSGQVANALIAGTVYTNAQPNITSVGTLSGLSVTGDSTFTGNVTVSGSFQYSNVTTLRIKDPIIEQGGNTNGSALTTNDGFDRGQLLHYFDGTPLDAFMGWDNSNSEFGLGSIVTVSGEVVTFNTYGNLRAGYFLGNGSQLTGIIANANYASFTGNVVNAIQSNITSVGTLASLNVTANVSSGNANLGNLVTANYFTGNGSLLTAINGSNVTSQVANAAIAGTVYTNAQPNITSVGTLSSLTVTANISSGNANLGNLITANYFTGNGSLLTNLNGANVTGQVGNSLIAGTVYTNAQPNITSVGTLSTLNVSANISSGNANLGNLVTANYFSGDGGFLSNLQIASYTVANANYSNFAGTVVNAIQSNITSVGTLASLNVTANISSGNANLGNLVTANYFTGTLTTNAQPNITSVGTLSSLNVTANISSGNANLGNLVTANYFSGAGNLLSNIVGGNVTGQVANAAIAGTVYTNAQPNITSVGTLSTVNVSGNVTSGGNVIVTANISSGNANLGNLVTANYFTGTLTTNAQPNITSVGTLSSLSVTGNISGSNVMGTMYPSSTGIIFANPEVAEPHEVAYIKYTEVSTEMNVLELGVIDDGEGYSIKLNATGGVTVVNSLTADHLVGEGGNISNVQAALTAGTVTTNAQPNITSVGTLSTVNVSGNITSGGNVIVTANVSAGNANLGNLVTANYITGTLTTNAQPNITSVGILNGLSVSGDTSITGNLTVTGTVEIANVSTFKVKDPIIEQGGNTTGTPLSSNDGFDRGQLLHYYSGAAIDAFMGWDNSNAEFAFGSNVSVSSEVVTFNNFGNVRANYFLGNGSQLTGVVANSNYAAYAGVVTANAQPNITSVGSLSGLTVSNASGTVNFVTTSNVSLGAIANLHISGGTSGYLLTTDGSGTLTWSNPASSGLSGANTQVQFNDGGVFGASSNFTFNKTTGLLSVTGNVQRNGKSLMAFSSGSNPPSSPVAGDEWYDQDTDIIYKYIFDGTSSYWIDTTSGYISASQTAISGTLVQRDANANIAANYFIGNGSMLTGVGSAGGLSNGTSNITAGTVNGNITVGIAGVSNTVIFTSTGMNVISTGGINAGNIVTANFFSGAGNLLSNVQGANVSGQVANANYAAYAGNVINAAQPNITSVGTLANLVVNGNITGGSGTGGTISGANLVSANYITGTLTTAAQPNITSVGTLASLNVTGNVTAAYLVGNGSQLTGLPASYANSNVAAYLPTYTGNITGNIVTLTGNITAINANLGNLVTANYHSGSGNLLSNIQGANVTGTVANATYAVSAGSATTAGTVTTAAQPNITSVGTLTSLAVTGNISGANLTGNHYGTGSALSSLTGANVTGTVANATYAVSAGSATTATTAGTVTTAAQPNITSVGTLVSLTSGLITATSGGIKVGNIQDPSGTNTISLASGNVTMLGNLTVGTGGTGNVTATYFIGNGASLTSLAGANITGTVANANYAAYAGNVVNASQPNITSVGTLASLSVTANITSGSGSGGNITGANLISSNYFTGVLTTAAQPNITSVGTLATLNVTGNVTASYLIGNGSQLTGLPAGYANSDVANYLPTYTGNITGNIVTLTGNVTASNANLGNLVTSNYFTGNGSLLTSLTGANVTGTVANATYAVSAGSATTAGTVTTAAQPNITSVGTLSSLSVTANISSGNANLGNLVTANYFSGDGGLLSNLQIASATVANSNHANISDVANSVSGSNVTGQVSNALIAGTVYTAAQPNITSVGTLSSLTVTANVTSSNANLGNLVTANYFTGNGSLLTALTGANITGTVANANYAAYAGNIVTEAQPNITSLGTLSGLTVSGDTTLTGNLTVSGTFEYANVTSFKVKDPIIEQGGNPNGTALSSNDGFDRGQLLHYYSGTAKDAFMGWDNSNAEFAFGSNVSVSSEVVTFNNFGNIRANYFLGNGSQLTGTIANANYAAYVGDVINATQSNITSVGTLADLTVAGNVNTSTIKNGSTGIYMDGGYPGYINFFNGTANPTVTIGDNGNLNVIGNITSANASLGNLVTANYFTGNGSLLSSLSGGNVTGQVANALIATTVTASAQPNITSIGTLSNLTSNGTVNFTNASNVSLGNVANIKIGGGTAGYILQSDGTGNVEWVDNVPSTVTYTANSISLTNGVYVSGDVTDIQSFGDYGSGNVYVLTDGTGSAPAWYVDIDFVAVSSFNRVVLNINYTQASGHTIYVQLYNTSTSAWDSIGTYTGLGSYYAFALEVIDSANYISSGIAQLRLYHSNSGNSGHQTSIDYAALELSSQGPQGPRGPTGATGSTGAGVASGGTAGQILVKNSSTNYDTIWSSDLTGLGNVTLSGNLIAANANLGNVVNANFYTGNGYYLTGLARATSADSVANGTSNVNIPVINGNATVSVGGTVNVAVITSTGANIAGYANITGIANVGGNLNVTGNAAATNLRVSGVANLINASNVALGSVNNVHISGGTTGYVLSTNGSGGLSWVNPTSTLIGGTDTQIQYNNGGVFAGSGNFTFDNITNTLAVDNVSTLYNVNAQGDLNALGNVSATGGYLSLNSAVIAVSGGSAGIFTTAISNLNIGLSGNITMGSSSGNTTARGNLIANSITSNTTVSANTVTATNIAVNDFYSNRAAVYTPINTDTVIDVFPVSLYRTAKYTIRVNSDDGYQSIEALLIHDSANALITVYGSISTTGNDIAILTSDINLGNVRLIATSASANTWINMIGTYVADN